MFNISFGAIILFALVSIWLLTSSSEAAFVSTGRKLKLVNGQPSTHLTFDLGTEITLDTRVLFSAASPRTFVTAGVSAQYHYLSDAAYRTLKTKYGNSKRCPASFLNWNAKHLMILTEDNLLAQKLNTEVKEGDAVKLTGAYLQFSEGAVGGRNATAPTGNMRYFLLRSASISGRLYQGRAAIPISDIEIRLP